MQNMIVAFQPLRSGQAILRLFMMLALMCSIFLLSACGKQQLYSSLSEEHANEMVAVLGEAGIDADKSLGEEEKWTVSVAQSEFAKSVDILRTRGLPHEQFESMGTVFKPGGINETPLAQRARLNYALSQELSQTINEIDGVVSARVQLAMPQPSPLTNDVKPSSASVLVKYRSGFDLRSQKASIQSLVAKGVEGLSFDQVEVIMVPAQALPLAKRSNDGVSFGTIGRILLALFALGILLFAARAWMRQRKASRIGRSIIDPADLDGIQH